MKLAVFLLLSTLAQAQSVGVAISLNVITHPVRTYRESSNTKWYMLAAGSLLEAANLGDYLTTKRGAFPGTGGCELNPLFTSAPCVINVPRFTGVKIGIAAFGIAQWVPIWAGYRSENYKKLMTVMDLVGAVPMTVIDLRNVHELHLEGK